MGLEDLMPGEELAWERLLLGLWDSKTALNSNDEV